MSEINFKKNKEVTPENSNDTFLFCYYASIILLATHHFTNSHFLNIASDVWFATIVTLATIISTTFLSIIHYLFNKTIENEEADPTHKKVAAYLAIKMKELKAKMFWKRALGDIMGVVTLVSLWYMGFHSIFILYFLACVLSKFFVHKLSSLGEDLIEQGYVADEILKDK